jgi:hypothetical protein
MPDIEAQRPSEDVRGDAGDMTADVVTIRRTGADSVAVKTVGLLVTAIGMTLIRAGCRRHVHPDVAILAGLSAAALAIVDVVFRARATPRPRWRWPFGGGATNAWRRTASRLRAPLSMPGSTGGCRRMRLLGEGEGDRWRTDARSIARVTLVYAGRTGRAGAASESPVWPSCWYWRRRG